MKTKKNLQDASIALRAMSETLLDMIGVMRCISDHLEDKECEHEQAVKTVKAKDAKNESRVTKNRKKNSSAKRRRGRPAIEKSV
jgi:hypothetical protein